MNPGDYVVHHQHGVARYAGMVTREIMGVERDYLILEYKGNDKLYLPSEQIDLIRPYSGGESPALNKMGGADFQKTKAKVRAAVEEVAQELVVLYQRSGHHRGPCVRARHPVAGASSPMPSPSRRPRTRSPRLPT